jgi:hypothetical protein
MLDAPKFRLSPVPVETIAARDVESRSTTAPAWQEL